LVQLSFLFGKELLFDWDYLGSSTAGRSAADGRNGGRLPRRLQGLDVRRSEQAAGYGREFRRQPVGPVALLLRTVGRVGVDVGGPQPPGRRRRPLRRQAQTQRNRRQETHQEGQMDGQTIRTVGVGRRRGLRDAGRAQLGAFVLLLRQRSADRRQPQQNARPARSQAQMNAIWDPTAS